MADNSLNVNRPTRESVVPEPTITRQAPKESVQIGTPRIPVKREKLFHYDVAEGLKTAGAIKFTVSRPDRMSDEEAGDRMRRLMSMYSLVSLPEAQYFAFQEALFVTYALVGGSVVSPNSRASFTVMGVTRMFSEVSNFLGQDIRRFFRAYADAVVSACKRVYFDYDPLDEEQVLVREQLIQLADMRRLSRKPWLVADCADAAYNIDPDERQMVVASKESVIGAAFNAPDRRNLAQPIHSYEQFDSSSGQVMSEPSPGRGAGPGQYR